MTANENRNEAMDLASTASGEENETQSFTQHLAEERKRKHGKKHHHSGAKLESAKEKLASDANDLLARVNEALGEMEHKDASHPGSYHTAEHLQEFETVKASAQAVLAALHNPDTSLDKVIALSRLETTIKTNFKLSEADKTKANAAGDTEEIIEDRIRTKIAVNEDLNEKVRIQRQLEREHARAHPWMITLRGRNDEIASMIDENSALATQASAMLAAGSADLQATAALAAVMYDMRNDPQAAQERIAEFLAAKKQEMIAGGAESPDERLALIARNASYVHEGMMQSHKEGANRLLAVADNYVNAPLREQLTLSSAHFDAAEAHLKERDELKLGKHHKKHLADFERRKGEWSSEAGDLATRMNDQLEQARQRLSGLTASEPSNGEELYNSLMKRLKLDEMVDNASHYVEADTRILGNQMTDFCHERDKNLAAQEMLANVLTGQSRHLSQDMDVAYSLGMSPRALRTEALKFRDDTKGEIGHELIKAYAQDALQLIRAGKEHGMATHG